MKLRLLELRKVKGVLQRDVAKALGVGTSTYSYYERNVHCPDADTLCKIADYFNVSLDEVFGRTSSDIFDDARIEQFELLQLYHNMTSEEKSNLIGYARGLISGRKIKM